VSERALRDGIMLKQAALDDARITGVLSADEISQALNPSRYLGSSNAFIDLALASYRYPS
jgi:adenylosuccinate lyase